MIDRMKKENEQLQDKNEQLQDETARLKAELDKVKKDSPSKQYSGKVLSSLGMSTVRERSSDRSLPAQKQQALK